MLPGLTGVLAAAALIGIGTGLITPLGFAAPAAATPAERLGRTMGSAELGRELGDAGGPLPVAAVASVARRQDLVVHFRDPGDLEDPEDHGDLQRLQNFIGRALSLDIPDNHR
ncbi:hypothetical protein M1L21_29520 [Streptomyces sp. AS02]|nr:hypothetical protein [Streptomyces sp. AS02]